MNEASNVLSPDARISALRLRIVDKMEDIIRESVKPMENIDSIKIMHLDGVGNIGGGLPREEGGGVADGLVSSALRYRAQAPIVDHLLQEIGLDGANLQGTAKALLTSPAGSGEPESPKGTSR